MYGYRMLASGMVMLLSMNTFAMEKVVPTQCTFSPYLKCAAQGITLWGNPQIKEPTPIVSGNSHIYLSQNNTVLSIEARTGKFAWKAHAGDETRYFQPVIDADYVYLARTDGNLEKRHKRSGNLLWSRTIGSGWIYPPIATGKSLITAGQDRMLWILDAHTGAIQEQIPLSQELVAPLYHLDEVFIAATFDSKVSAYTIGPTKPDWQSMVGNPVFDFYRYGNNLIVADMGGNVSAIDAQTGQLRWQQQVHNNAQFWNVLHQHTLYSLTDSGTLTILDANNGKPLNRLEFAHQFAQAPIVQDELLALFDTEGSTLHVSIDEPKNEPN